MTTAKQRAHPPKGTLHIQRGFYEQLLQELEENAQRVARLARLYLDSDAGKAQSELEEAQDLLRRTWSAPCEKGSALRVLTQIQGEAAAFLEKDILVSPNTPSDDAVGATDG